MKTNRRTKMPTIKFDSRVFESDKELMAYKLGYQDASEEAHTYYTDEDMEIAEEKGYLRGYNEAIEEREDHPDSSHIVSMLSRALDLSGGHWEYVIQKALLIGDNNALSALLVELEKRNV